MNKIIEIKKAIFDLGTIHLFNYNRPVEVEVKLETTSNGRQIFFATGSIYTSNFKKGYLEAGQCLDKIKEHIAELEYPKLFGKIYYFWKMYHCNDLHVGTKRQEDYLKAIGLINATYDEQCKALKEVGLYIDTNELKPYTFGHEWKYQPIPEYDLEEIKALFTE